VFADIHGACDVLDAVYAESDGVDGYASVEVAPSLAHDESGTVEAARDLHRRLDRRNLMVKIPATAEGVPAIRQMISEGRNINVTLIFSLDRYADVMEAYISGLETYTADANADLSRVASVGSFFVSRVDTEVDRRLEAIGTDQALALRGKAAVAQAQLAYKQFTDAFGGARWEALAARGARVQRPLWASTGTKNKAYSDVLYVEQLIGPDTVNTLTEATIEAFEDHGQLRRTVDADLDGAERVWSELAAVGVDMDDVSARLEREGVDSFTKSFDELIEALQAKVDVLRN
jgi:transaldolase